MDELVRSTSNRKLLSSARLPSFAGNGLPERMRSLSFALLGLTAAAGLALVAIFAQPSFPLLSPAPLPAEPSAHESIAVARPLPHGHGSVALLTVLPAPEGRNQAATADAAVPVNGPSSSGGASEGADGSQVAPAEVDVPVSTGTPQPSSGESGGGGTGRGSGPPPAGGAAQPASSVPAPASTAPAAGTKPEPVGSSPQPASTPAPGNSASTAAAEHASERGIEASASAGPPASTVANTSSVAPESSSAPSDGSGADNGLAKGHDK